MPALSFFSRPHTASELQRIRMRFCECFHGKVADGIHVPKQMRESCFRLFLVSRFSLSLLLGAKLEGAPSCATQAGDFFTGRGRDRYRSFAFLQDEVRSQCHCHFPRLCKRPIHRRDLSTLLITSHFGANVLSTP